MLYHEDSFYGERVAPEPFACSAIGFYQAMRIDSKRHLTAYQGEGATLLAQVPSGTESHEDRRICAAG